MFITLYGINNIGKSTHAKLLAKRLRKETGKEVVYIKYPIYDAEPTGPIINRAIRNHDQHMSEEELQLWFVLNRFQFESTLKQHLDNGKIVLAEDYVWTGIAWGAVKGANLAWLKTINEPLLQEDLSVLLHGNREIRAQEKTHIHETNHDLVAACQDQFLSFADEFGWKKVEIQKKIAHTAELLWETVSSHLSSA